VAYERNAVGGAFLSVPGGNEIMDLWVRSEYAGELAVVSAWLTALLPWSVGYGSVVGGTLLDVRFPFLRFRFTVGVPITRAVDLSDPVSAMVENVGTTAFVAYQSWVVAAGVVAVAVALSVGYYLREERVESAPIDPVRVMGVLLLAGGGTFFVGTYLFLTNAPGITVPVGALVVPLFGVVLLRVDREPVVDADESAAEAETDAEEEPPPDASGG